MVCQNCGEELTQGQRRYCHQDDNPDCYAQRQVTRNKRAYDKSALKKKASAKNVTDGTVITASRKRRAETNDVNSVVTRRITKTTDGAKELLEIDEKIDTTVKNKSLTTEETLSVETILSGLNDTPTEIIYHTRDTTASKLAQPIQFAWAELEMKHPGFIKNGVWAESKEAIRMARNGYGLQQHVFAFYPWAVLRAHYEELWDGSWEEGLGDIIVMKAVHAAMANITNIDHVEDDSAEVKILKIEYTPTLQLVMAQVVFADETFTARIYNVDLKTLLLIKGENNVKTIKTAAASLGVNTGPPSTARLQAEAVAKGY